MFTSSDPPRVSHIAFAVPLRCSRKSFLIIGLVQEVDCCVICDIGVLVAGMIAAGVTYLLLPSGTRELLIDVVVS